MSNPPKTDDSSAEGTRIQKLLAAAGIDSRRKCEEYVTAGRVTVDGEVVTDLGRRVDPSSQDVRLDGERLRPQKKRHYLLNKPTGYLCTNYDQSGRRLAVDLIPSAGTRLFSVGRLDEGSQGLLIVTNDGELAEKLAHPRYQVPRVYKIQVAGVPTAQTLAELRKGIHFTEGKFGLKRTKRLKTHGQSTFLEVELTRGQNREIRRLFSRVGHKVMWLQRVSFGPLKLGDLAVGQYRPLRSEEVRQLQEFVRKSGKPESVQRPKKARPPAKTGPRTSDAARPAGRRILDVSEGTRSSTRASNEHSTDRGSADKQPGGHKPTDRKPGERNFTGEKRTAHKPGGRKPSGQGSTGRKPSGANAHAKHPGKVRKRR
ncbi:MAG: rRNA pseudouridine synthase [Planctomycetaceae bacterium]|nr:rRNA pseudouridine synthase [Planctomycetaceae bacterium]